MMAKLVLQQRQQEELLQQVESLRWKVEENLHGQLMDAMGPLAAALKRQDSLHNQYYQDQVSLLLEVLSSLQPTAKEQIYPRIGQPPPMNSSPSLAS